MDRKLCFQQPSPHTACLVSDLNTGVDLDLSELVSLFSFLFFFVCDISVFRWGVHARAYQSQSSMLGFPLSISNLLFEIEPLI